MRLRRRRRQSPPAVVLPSLDRLAGLIERVVALVDEVAGGPVAAPEPAPTPAPERAPELQAAVSEPVPERSWLAFVPSPEGYALAEQSGTPPKPGDSFDLDGVDYRVLRYSPSPLPADHRRCAFVERKEPPEAERTFDA